jgi:hypothetical protein
MSSPGNTDYDTQVDHITEMTPVKVPYVIPGNTDYDTPINPITEMTPVKVPYGIPWKHRL